MSGSGGNNVASGLTLDDVSDVHRGIGALFCWNPRTLILPDEPQEIYSTKTRPHKFYDKHFDDRLILRRVEPLPSLVRALATNVDQMLSAALDTLPSKPLTVSAQRRDDDAAAIPNDAPDEKAVASYYLTTTAIYCPAIASALVLHP